ncbi:MAG: fpg2 [Cyanobacteria bacterium RYN_339]|nr:fpg2 [Cyanobacteria bacterium RYN_339]
MPELPDIEVYLDALREFVVGTPLQRVVVRSPSLMRTVDPPLAAVEGRLVEGVRRIGKRLVFDVAGGVSIVIHLMIAGRLHWKKPGVKPAGKNDLAAFAFEHGTLMLTEASTKKRATLHVVRTEEAVAAFSRGGLDVLTADLDAFRAVLKRENHTLKRTLTDPRLFDGIGNAYSDEILHAACLAPTTWSTRLDEEGVVRLYEATRAVLVGGLETLRKQRKGFPEKVTAFRPEFAVHGKYKIPCPRCQTPVQRIAYADNETNYCPTCQTGGKLLADRSFSRLLRDDWPKTLDELEALKERQRQGG